MSEPSSIADLISTQSSQPSTDDLIVPRTTSISRPPLRSILTLSNDKAKAFEIFKRGYPSGDWIDNQKHILKEKYTVAKRIGEEANSLRLRMKTLKQCIEDGKGGNPERKELMELVTQYKDSYTQLKEFKIEIEHLQHLLEAARKRLTRDFEHWYENVYEETAEMEDDGFNLQGTMTYPAAAALAKSKIISGQHVI